MSLLELVILQRINRMPIRHSFSTVRKQKGAIAKSLVMIRVLLCDEATSTGLHERHGHPENFLKKMK